MGRQSANNWPTPIGPQAVIDHEYLRPLMDIGRSLFGDSRDGAGLDVAINTHTEADEPQLIRPRSSQPDLKLPFAPQSQSIPADNLYERFRYEPVGHDTSGMILSDPSGSFRALEIGDRAERTAEAEYPGRSISDNEGDAFKHALWSYEMTLRHGPDWAKKFTDAHERNPSPDRFRVMDLHNNQVGRALALDPRNWGRPAEDVIREALKDGRLQLRPFSIRPRSPYRGM
jgi:hypothetical protein